MTIDDVVPVEFYPDEGFPLSIGYMVGPDDGKSMLYVTPEEALGAWNERVEASK